MMKNPNLAKSIADASWGDLIRQLEYKSAWHDRDTNAAINIKERATGNMKPRCDKNTEQIAVGQTVLAWETYIEH
jgi:transposase